jgi:hypothetical protein
VGPFDQWPTGLGFERFFGNVIGESDLYSPVAHDNTTLAPPSKDPNYYYPDRPCRSCDPMDQGPEVPESRQGVLSLLPGPGHARSGSAPQGVAGQVQGQVRHSFDDAQATSARTTQYYEIFGNRGIYKDGWYASTLHKVAWKAKPRTSYADDQWELCNTAEDYSCSTDVSAQYPEKLKALQAAFMEEAIKYNVLPLDDRAQERFNATLAGRPEYMGRRTSLTLYPGMIAMKENAFIDEALLMSGGAGALETIQARPPAASRWPPYRRQGAGGVQSIPHFVPSTRWLDAARSLADDRA